MRNHEGRCQDGSRWRGFVVLWAACAGLLSLGAVVSPASAAPLPENRAYELVSPADAQGTSAWSLFDSTDTTLLRGWSPVAADGSAVYWRSTTALSADPESSGLFDTYRSVRGANSWETKYAGTPSLTTGIIPADLQFLSTGGDRALWYTYNASIDPSDHDPVPPPNEPFTYRDLYGTGADGTIVHVNRDLTGASATGEEPAFFGASEDARKVLFKSNRPLVPGAPSGGVVSTYWTDGQTTKLVTKDPSGAPFVLDGNASYSIDPIGVSPDGSIALFLYTDQTGSAAQTLYLWSAASDSTTKLIGPITGGLAVDSISPDGNKLFFLTSASLSARDTDTSRDLYEYDVPTGEITLLSAPSGAGTSGNSDACATPLPGSARCDVAAVIETRDGSAAYFASPEQILPGQGVDGGLNLYRAAGGQIRFVATLASADPVIAGALSGGGDVITAVRTRHVRLTPDGSKLLFESRAKLTDYDNATFMEVYLYDPGSGAIVCASCRANGTPPTADSTLYTYSGGASALIGGYYRVYSNNADTHGDHVFFNSGDAVVPGDVNGQEDVYEFTVASRTPTLISSGRSERDSAFVGSGADGKDVFFLTSDSLVPQDRNGDIYKVYDARRGGGFSVPPEPSVCDGAACRADEAAPPPGAQGSGRVVPRPRRAPTESEVVASRLVVSGSRSVKGSSARLTAKVSGAGRLKVTGRGLAAVSRQTSRAASYHVTVRLSKASVAKLHRAGRVVASATVRFVPVKGAARSVRVRLTFSAKSTRNAR